MVFRHYAHLTPSSCTSERLGASSELSSTFTPHRHSSLSFGSYTETSSLSTPDPGIVSLVRVSRRAKLLSLSIHIFILHQALFTLRSLYFFAIGHRLYLALDRRHHPFTLHYQTVLLPSISPHAYGDLPLCVCTSHALRRTGPHTTRHQRRLPRGLLPFHSPLLRES